MTVNTTDSESVTANVEQRLAELHHVRATLWRDRDDPRVLSELVTVASRISAIEATQRGCEK